MSVEEDDEDSCKDNEDDEKQEGQGAVAQEKREAYDNNEDENEDENESENEDDNEDEDEDEEETDNMDNDANNETDLKQEAQLTPGIRKLTGPLYPLSTLSKQMLPR